jgi:hypothetical protein
MTNTQSQTTHYDPVADLEEAGAAWRYYAENADTARKHLATLVNDALSSGVEAEDVGAVAGVDVATIEGMRS